MYFDTILSTHRSKRNMIYTRNYSLITHNKQTTPQLRRTKRDTKGVCEVEEQSTSDTVLDVMGKIQDSAMIIFDSIFQTNIKGIKDVWTDTSEEDKNEIKQCLNRNYEAINRNYRAINRNNFAINRNFGAINRNYGAINRNYDAINRNYDAIINLHESMIINFELTRAHLNQIDIKLDNILEEIHNSKLAILASIHTTRTEPIISQLKTFSGYFKSEIDSFSVFSDDELLDKLEKRSGLLEYLQKSRLPTPGSLNSLLNDIINQKFAIPTKAEEEIAFMLLELLCQGVYVHYSISSFLFVQYHSLAQKYYNLNNVDKYNTYLGLANDSLRDFTNSLVDFNVGLIGKVSKVLDSVEQLVFVKDEKIDVLKYISINRENFSRLKVILLKATSNLSLAIPEKAKLSIDFSKSKTQTPFFEWKDGRTVSYALQLKDKTTNVYSQVGKWSKPFTIHGNANPIVKVTTNDSGKTRIIFRKFDNEMPKMVALLTDSAQTQFTDIDRDLFDAAHEPNEQIAVDKVAIVLQKGANVNAFFDKHKTALHVAAENGNLKVALALFKNGAKFDTEDINGFTPIHIAAYKGRLSFIEGILDGNVTDINIHSANGFTPLHSAVMSGHTEIVQLIVSHPYTDTRAQTDLGFTALHLAAINDHLKIVQTLLNNNLTKAHVNAQSLNGLTALHIAINKKFDNVSFALIQTASINLDLQDYKTKLTPLHLAAINTRVSVANKLIDRGANVNTLSNGNFTALHFGALYANSEMTTLLLEKGASIDAKTNTGMMPLHFASESGDVDVVGTLIHRHKLEQSIDIQDYSGRTPLYIAFKWNNTEVANLLIHNCADVNVVLSQSKSLLHLAAIKGDHLAVTNLIEKGLNLDDIAPVSGVKSIPLCLAVRHGNVEVVRILLKNGTNPNWYINDAPITNTILSNIWHIENEIALFKIVKLLQKYGTKIRISENFCKKDKLFAMQLIFKHFIEHQSKMDSDIHMKAIECAVRIGRHDLFKSVFSFQVWNKSDTSAKKELMDDLMRFGVLETVKFLKSNHMSGFNNIDFYNSLVYKAVEGDNFKVFDFLLNHRVEFAENGIDTVFNKEILKNVLLTIKLLYLSAKNGNLKIFEFLFINYYLDSPPEFFMSDCSLLMSAIKGEGDIAMVQFIVQKFVPNYNEKDKNSKTLLHFACDNGKYDIVWFLLSNGASVNAVDKWGFDALAYAITGKGNLDMVELLVQHGAHLIDEFKDNQRYSYLNYALKANKLDIVNYLIKRGIELGKAHWTALHEAAYYGNLQLVQIALAKNTTDINAKYLRGRTPLLAAVFYKKANLDVVKLLVSKGADLKAKFDNETIFSIAAKQGHFKIVEYLIKQALEAKYSYYYRPLNINFDNYKNTVVYYKLLINGGMDIEETDQKGNTALHYACYTEDVEIVQILMNKGANIMAKNKNGATPLDIAFYESSERIYNYLHFSYKNKLGQTMLHQSVLHSNSRITEQLLGPIGENVNPKDNMGLTPLHLALQTKNSEIIRLFAENKCVDFSVRNNYGLLPLDYARSLNLGTELIDLLEKLSNKKVDTTKPLNAERNRRNVPANYISEINCASSSANRPLSFVSSVKALSTQVLGGIGKSVSQLFASPFGGQSTFESALHGHNLHSQTNFFDSTLIMLDILVRKLTGRKYSLQNLPSLNPISPQLEIRSLALNITSKLESLMPSKQYDFMLYKSVESCLMRGDLCKMSRVVHCTLSDKLNESHLDTQCVMNWLLSDQFGQCDDGQSFA